MDICRKCGQQMKRSVFSWWKEKEYECYCENCKLWWVKRDGKWRVEDFSNPPTEKDKYVGSKYVGTCSKCGQPIYEPTTVEVESYSISRGGIEWLEMYVEKKLRDSGVIPEDALYDLVNKIVHRALRAGTYKLPDRYVPDGKGGFKLVKGRFACLDQADFEIKWAIQNPPSPISKTRFSLKAFIRTP